MARLHIRLAKAKAKSYVQMERGSHILMTSFRWHVAWQDSPPVRQQEVYRLRHYHPRAGGWVTVWDPPPGVPPYGASLCGDPPSVWSPLYFGSPPPSPVGRLTDGCKNINFHIIWSVTIAWVWIDHKGFKDAVISEYSSCNLVWLTVRLYCLSDPPSC